MYVLPFEGLNVIRNNLFGEWRLKIHNFLIQCLNGRSGGECGGTCVSLAAKFTKRTHTTSGFVFGTQNFALIPCGGAHLLREELIKQTHTSNWVTSKHIYR